MKIKLKTLQRNENSLLKFIKNIGYEKMKCLLILLTILALLFVLFIIIFFVCACILNSKINRSENSFSDFKERNDKD